MAPINYPIQQSIPDQANKGGTLTLQSLSLIAIGFSLAFINSSTQADSKTIQEKRGNVESEQILLIAHHASEMDNQSISAEGLANAETQLLQKTYENDPMSKRLQRLELLTFGTTQYGSNNERWSHIQSYLRNKNNNLKSNRLPNNLHSRGNMIRSLNELEIYVFKRNSPTETPSKRLDKLEAKLFGKVSDNMPEGQRILRLQRTLGLASTPEQMADARPSIRGFSFRQGQPGMPNTFGFNHDDMNDPELNQLNSEMSQMMREMQRQMQEQMQEQGRMPNPRQMPYYGAPHIMPKSSPGEKIPAYNDPNFI